RNMDDESRICLKSRATGHGISEASNFQLHEFRAPAGSSTRWCRWRGRFGGRQIRQTEQSHAGRPRQASHRTKRLIDGGRFITTVDHAINALLIAARATVILPLRGFHQFLESLAITFVDEIAGLLPAKEV